MRSSAELPAKQAWCSRPASIAFGGEDVDGEDRMSAPRSMATVLFGMSTEVRSPIQRSKRKVTTIRLIIPMGIMKTPPRLRSSKKSRPNWRASVAVCAKGPARKCQASVLQEGRCEESVWLDNPSRSVRPANEIGKYFAAAKVSDMFLLSGQMVFCGWALPSTGLFGGV